MTYRDDLDALAARQATLQAELGRKQRELAEVSGMLAEAREAQRPERYFHAPDLRRRPRRHLIAAAMVVTLGSGAAAGAVAATDPGWPPTGSAEVPRGHLVRIRTNQASLAQAQRAQAELEALRALGLLPIDPSDPSARGLAVAKRIRPQPLWHIGPSLPPGAPWDRRFTLY
jgi:hypothetical protein